MRVRWSNVPVPEENLVAIGVGLALQRVTPTRLDRRARSARTLGMTLIAAGALLAGWAVLTMAEVDSEAPSELVTTGPYAHSRNPMYLAWALVQAGFALAVGAPWVLASLPAALAYTHRVVIPREEEQLAAAFGDAYRRYRARVRRYV